MQMHSQPEASTAQSVPSKSPQFTDVFGESRGRVRSLHTAAGAVRRSQAQSGAVRRSPRTSESLNLLCLDPSLHGPHTTSECISPAAATVWSMFEALGKSNAYFLTILRSYAIILRIVVLQNHSTQSLPARLSRLCPDLWGFQSGGCLDIWKPRSSPCGDIWGNLNEQ